MPPKAKLDREKIINAALDEVRECGVEGLNARRLAARLKCSTTPVFSCFGSMEEVKAEVVRRANGIYTAFIDEGLAEEKSFKGVGKGYIRFAYAEPQLFRLLFMAPQKNGAALPEADPNSVRIGEAAAAASGLDRAKAKKLYMEMWIFVHGIATMSVTGTLEFSEEEIGAMLTDAFRGIKNSLEEK